MAKVRREVNVNAALFVRAFALVDTEGSQRLDLKRFACGISRMCGTGESTRRFLFELTDVTSSGELRAADVGGFLGEAVPALAQMSLNLIGAEHNFIRREGCCSP